LFTRWELVALFKIFFDPNIFFCQIAHFMISSKLKTADFIFFSVVWHSGIFPFQNLRAWAHQAFAPFVNLKV